MKTLKTEAEIKAVIQKLETKFSKVVGRIEKYINNHPKGLDAETKYLKDLQAKGRSLRDEIDWVYYLLEIHNGNPDNLICPRRVI